MTEHATPFDAAAASQAYRSALEVIARRSLDTVTDLLLEFLCDTAGDG